MFVLGFVSMQQALYLLSVNLISYMQPVVAIEVWPVTQFMQSHNGVFTNQLIPLVRYTTENRKSYCGLLSAFWVAGLLIHNRKYYRVC